jgi:hypothetical protein
MVDKLDCCPASVRFFKECKTWIASENTSWHSSRP